mgnify:CR=1 FL=1
MITQRIAELLADSNPLRLAAVSPAHANAVIDAARNKGFLIWTLNGRQMKNDETVFNHFAQVLRFPDYFGRNWDEMDECLRDLGWAPSSAYLLAINDADALFLTSPTSFKALIDCLRFVSKHWPVWQNKKIPFKVLFVTESPEIASLTDIAFLD